jgi:hypothetical protein
MWHRCKCLSVPAFARVTHAVDRINDGRFQGFPSDLAAEAASLDDMHAPFPQSRADLAIRVVSTLFAVYAKSPLPPRGC